MTEPKKTTRKRILAVIIATFMIIASTVFMLSLGETKATATRTSSLDLVTDGNSNDDSHWDEEKWKWNTETNTLTLADGFELTPADNVKPAMILRAGTTIILEGSAVITSDQKGIETTGDLTIQSAEGKKGYLKIKINGAAPEGYLYYGIEIKNDKGTEARTLTVTNRAILEVDSTGIEATGRNGSILCSAVDQGNGRTIASNTKASLVITDQSVVQLRNAASVAKGFQLNSQERILCIQNGTTPSLLKESVVRDLTNEADITMMTCAIEGAYDNEAITTYSLTYDGKDHPVIFNTEDEDAIKSTTYDDDDTVDGRLKKLGTPVLPIIIKPDNFGYYESVNSEFLNNGSDYRDKSVVFTETQYTNFKSSARGKLINAAKYHITYNNVDFAILKINQREVEITGLKAKDKTYDGWPDAQIDYSEISYKCRNDLNVYDDGTGKVMSTQAGSSKTTGIVETDESKIGTDIIPYAKAYFISTDGDGADVNNPFGNNVDYKRSKNVAYEGDGTSAQNTLAVKMVYIDNGRVDDTTVEGLPTGITLGDPNYKVMTPSATNAKKSQIQSQATIYPRSLANTDFVSCKLTPNKVKWKEGGYREGTDIVESLTDISKRTPKNQGADFTVKLVKGTDYIVNPNMLSVVEVGEYEIKITGCNNYTGTIKPKWSIERAVREITIVEPDNKGYDRSAYVIEANNGVNEVGSFNYKIEDVSDPAHKMNITDNLESGSNLSVTYVGRNQTTYAESETAPTNAGDYTVKVKVAQTERYTAAEKTLDYTIYAKTVELAWTCEGGQADTSAAVPETYIYNGTPNVFSAVVTNAEGSDEVNVLGVSYKKGGQVLTAAPKDVGNYSVNATELSNPNYTLGSNPANAAACPAHEYVIRPAAVRVSWDVSGSPYTYDATDHTPEPTVLDLCRNSENVEDVVTVTAWSFTGADGNAVNDVIGNPYLQANGAVNVSNADVTITATALSDPNYQLADAADCSASFKIVPCDLGTLTKGTPDDHANAQIYAAKQYYTGQIEEPEIMWVSADGVKELQNFTEGKVTDYTKYTAEAKARLIDGYTASLATQSLEYNNIDDGKGMDILITGRNNFTGEVKLKWNVDKINEQDGGVEVRLNNYPASITYGTPCPDVSLTPTNDAAKPYITYVNEDIRKDFDKGLASYISYFFTGTERSGAAYESEQAPTQVGEYTITITLAETEHYKEVKNSQDFVITQKEVVLSGLEVEEIDYRGNKVRGKQYDGTRNATLDFKNSVWTGVGDDISAKDKSDIKEALSAKADTGYITYKAEFAGADVSWGMDVSLKKIVEPQDVTISNLAIKEDAAGLPKILYNFKIAATGNQSEITTGKILQRELKVTGVKAKDKEYDGNKEAFLDFSQMKIEGVVSKKDSQGSEVTENIDINMTGEFKDDPADVAIKAKDVKLDGGKPANKEVELLYDDECIVTEDKNVKVSNYIISGQSLKKTEAAIKPATLTVKGLKAETKTYDGAPDVTLDWDNTAVDGVCAGDVISVDKAANKTAHGVDKFVNGDVAYNKNNEVIAKTGTITGTYDVKLTGTYKEDNYTVARITFSGTIEPKQLNGIAWNFNNAQFSAIPTAGFETGSGICEGDTCEPVVQYYDAEDIAFANPITVVNYGSVDANTIQDYMSDNTRYVARVVGASNGNYIIDDNDAHISYAFLFDSGKDDVDLTISNYQKSEDGTTFSVTYGEKLPEVTYTFNNADIADENKEAQAKHFTYLYTGKELNGAAYEDSKPPVNAGSYKVTVMLEETAHYKAAKAQATFMIEPRTITILQGVSVEDKVYNGTDKAVLNFKKAVFDDVIAEDEAEFDTIFANGNYIQYNASFASKNVNYAEGANAAGEAGKTAAGQSVTVKDYAFIYNEKTPSVLYNYTLAKEGNIASLYGIIMPRAVTVTGIKASDKTYDGTDRAVLDSSNASFAGKLKGDSLTVEVAGSYKKTGSETEASDVLMDENAVVGMKNIAIDEMKLVAGDDDTVVGNYTIHQASYSSDLQAKILPRLITIKNGLKAVDKVYNASAVAAVDFADVVFGGVIGEDGKALKDLLAGEKSSHIAYNANFASKNVAYHISESGEKTVEEMAVAVEDFYFVIDETTPQLMKNYMITTEGSQTELTAKITPKPVTITGVVAKDKVYDGNDNADIDSSNIAFDGKYKGDLLGVEIRASYRVTGDEPQAADVLLDGQGAAADKDVAVDSLILAAGDDATIVDNYVIADGSKAEAMKLRAKILPKEITVKEGLKAKDKEYDASADAVIDFSGVTFAGTVGTDTAMLAELVNGEAAKYVTYKAEFVSKDAAYEEADNTVADIDVLVDDYAFVLDGAAPQIMKNYVIVPEGSQKNLKGKIMPKAVKVSGIKAKDKTYDGTVEAALDLDGITMDGIVGGDSLTVTVDGTFAKTGEEKPEDVLYTADGEAGKKKVSLVISGLAAKDASTNLNNYYLAKEGQQMETEAVIYPVRVTPAKWSLDEKTGMPVIVIDKEESENASVDEADVVICYFEEDDKDFANPVDADAFEEGKRYVARIEGYSNSNYEIEDEFKAVTYSFTYSRKDENTEPTTEPTTEPKTESAAQPATEPKTESATQPATEAKTQPKTEKSTQQAETPATEAAPTDDVKSGVVLDLNSGLLAAAKGKELTFKWGASKQADGYNVYTSTRKGTYNDPVKVMKGNSHTFKITDQKKYCYMYVEAFKIVNGEEAILAKSKELRWAGSKVSGVNAKAVKVKKKKLTVAVQKKVSVNASVTVTKKTGKGSKTQTIKGKKAGLVYWSTNKSIATVSSKGKIKGVKAGTCYIYAMAQNGKKQKVMVTVKK